MNGYKSKTQTLIDLILEKIESGEWVEGDRLPSQTAFREEYGYTYGTLRSAYLVLKTMGVVEGRQGDGVFVTKSVYTKSHPKRK